MDGLRLLLLVFGLIVIVGVYLYSRYQRKKLADSPQQDLFAEERKSLLGRSSQKQGRNVRYEPTLDGLEAQIIEDDANEDGAEEEGSGDDEQAIVPGRKIVTLRIIARNSGAFSGDELVLSLRGIGMRHGRFGIFHRLDGTSEDEIVFSAASLVEPGSFDLTNIREQQIPGISLFMVVPGPIEGAKAFDLMMAAARELARSLDAELLDESGSTLSIQRERYLREEIIQYEHSSVVA
jgi:cell division protein ZipA